MNKLPIFQKIKLGGINFEEERKLSSHILLYIYISTIIILFAVLSFRLFQLTIVKGDYYRRLSDENRIRELLIEPKRGTIVDRKGFPLAQNSDADVTKNDERLTSSRLYHSGDAIGPLLGYRQVADPHDMKNDQCIYKLKIGDKVGKKGVEKLFECELRGKHGKKLIEVDAQGKYLRTLSLLPPQNGKSLKLAIDLELQNKAYELIKNSKAAVVGTNPQTGEVLLLTSSPSFNPQEFENENKNILSSYIGDHDKPLFNRATEGTYPPGSIFKLILAIGALEEKKIDEKTLIEDTGTLKAGPLSFGNWYFLQYGKTDGMVDIVKAIKRSNDIFFYQLGDKLTPPRIKSWAELFGYGAETHIGLDESDGLIPSVFWKQEKLDERWYLGDTYNLSIGQGYLLVTPLQVNMMTSAIANSGTFCVPQLLKDDQTSHCKKLDISEKTLGLVKEGMKQACASGGTGWPLFTFTPQVACKTGTAESRGKDIPPHAWFTVFAPYDKPEIALTVLVEEAGQGSDVAAPIAKEILKTYFERKE